MRLLLDTHVALRAIVDSPRLPQSIRSVLLAPENPLVVSAASMREIAIKRSLRRGDRPLWGEAALRYLKGSGYTLLSMGSGPSAVAEGLSGHHPPPFARLLAAQALTEPLRMVTHNPCWRSIKKGSSRSDVYKKCPIRLECKGQEPTPVTSAADAAKLERFALEACTDCD